MLYSELCNNILDVCENSFTADQLAMFVQQAEQRIYNSVQLPALRKTSSGSLTVGNRFLSTPTDYVSAFSLSLVDPDTGEYTTLLNKDANFIREAYPTITATAKPKHYAMFGVRSDVQKELTLLVGPTPDKAYTAELSYYFYPESIVTAGATWLGDNFDSALLNGALVEAIRFMKGEQDMVKLYNDMYVQSIALLKNLGDGKERQDAYRSGQLRVSVN